MSILAASGWRSEMAHIKADVPPQVSCVFTLAPLSNSTLIASVFPLRAAIISAVSPSLVSDALGSAPALMSFSIMAALPFSVASISGVAPSRLAADTFAPARISRSVVARSFARTAQCSAVVPSTWGALTSVFFSSKERTASLFPFIAASAKSLAAKTLAGTNTATQHASTSFILICAPFKLICSFSTGSPLHVLQHHRQRAVIFHTDDLARGVHHHLARQRDPSFPLALGVQVQLDHRKLVLIGWRRCLTRRL